GCAREGGGSKSSKSGGTTPVRTQAKKKNFLPTQPPPAPPQGAPLFRLKKLPAGRYTRSLGTDAIGVDVKPVHVSFPSGRELLNGYWGLLENGGLVLYDHQAVGLSEGDKVALEEAVESSEKTSRLRGPVVRRPPHVASGH